MIIAKIGSDSNYQTLQRNKWIFEYWYFKLQLHDYFINYNFIILNSSKPPFYNSKLLRLMELKVEPLSQIYDWQTVPTNNHEK